MQKAGIIERSKTFGYNSPIILVRKSSGAHRFIIDLRSANAILEAPTLTLPAPQVILDEISSKQGRLYTVLDFHSGYFNYMLPENLRKFTRFEDPKTGLGYRFRALPQGLNVSPAIFIANKSDIRRARPGRHFCIYG